MPLTSLSICIPTYNFGQFIGETLESIVCQLNDGVEIIVLDGASTDNTSDVVRQFQENRPNLKYFRLDQKGGIDRDMAKSVELAIGEYCWLFSSDDVMSQGAIAKILTQIKHGHDLYLCKHINCSFNMEHLFEYPVLKTNEKLEFNLADQVDRRRYFELAQTTEAFFSFMGGIIIKKSKWDSVQMNEAFVGSCWGHVARIFELMPTGLTLKYLPEPLLLKRSDNDSFLVKGRAHRIGITVNGYLRIGSHFFGAHSLEFYNIRRVLKNEKPVVVFFHIRSLIEPGDIEELRLLNELFNKCYSGSDTADRFSRWVFGSDLLSTFYRILFRPLLSSLYKYNFFRIAKQWVCERLSENYMDVSNQKFNK